MGWAFNQRPSLLTMYVFILPDTLDQRPNNFFLNTNIFPNNQIQLLILQYTLTNINEKRQCVWRHRDRPNMV
jgi:hypothetical protein